MPKGVYPAEKNGKPHPAAGKSQNKYYANGELRPQRKSRAKADDNVGKEQIRDKKGGGMYSAIRQRATRKDKGKTKEKVAPKYSTINKPDKYSSKKKANVGMIYTAKPTPTQPEFDTDDEADNSFSIPKKMEFKPKAGFVDKNPPKGKSAYNDSKPLKLARHNRYLMNVKVAPVTGLHEYEDHTDKSGLFMDNGHPQEEDELSHNSKKAKKIKFKVSKKPARRIYTSGYLGGHALEGGYKANEFSTEQEAIDVASKHKGKVGGITKRIKYGKAVYGLRKGKQIKSVGKNKSEMSYLFG